MSSVEVLTMNSRTPGSPASDVGDRNVFQRALFFQQAADVGHVCGWSKTPGPRRRR